MSTHPGIDSRHIVLLGVSHGGIATLAASSDTFVPPGDPAHLAFVAFYPYCNSRYPEQMRLAAPLRIHAGALDDWTPVRPCAERAAMPRAANHGAEIRVHKGAHHSFAIFQGAAARTREVLREQLQQLLS